MKNYYVKVLWFVSLRFLTLPKVLKYELHTEFKGAAWGLLVKI